MNTNTPTNRATTTTHSAKQFALRQGMWMNNATKQVFNIFC
jgi:hypothetical protein